MVVFSPVAAQQVIIPFQVGQRLIHNVNTTQNTRTYQVSEREDASVFILAVAQDFNSSPAITLLDEETNRIAGMMTLNVSGMCLRLAPGTTDYTLTVAAETPENSTGTQIYGLELLENAPTSFDCDDVAMAALAADTFNATEDSTNNNLAELLNVGFFDDDDPNGPINPNDPTDPNGPTDCQAASGSSLVGVNIRALATTGSNIIGNIPLGDVVNVLGMVDGTDFLLVDNDGLLGFAAEAVVQLGGNCSSVPLVDVDGTVVIGTGETIDLGVNLDLNIDYLINAAVDAGATLNGNGVLVNLSADADALENDLLDVDATIGLDEDGLSIGADAEVLDGDLLDVDADTGIGEDGITLDVDADLGDNDLADADVNLNGDDDEPIIDVQVPPLDTGVTVGGGSGSGGSGSSCIVVLGIPVGC